VGQRVYVDVAESIGTTVWVYADDERVGRFVYVNVGETFRLSVGVSECEANAESDVGW